MDQAGPISVLIVDDIRETHENLKKLLFFEKDIKVAGIATSGTQAIEMTKKLAPDVILMDINMPGMDGISATEAIVASGAKAQVIMMSIQGDTDYLRRSMLAGAREFLIKPFSGEELANSVRRVHNLRIERAPVQVERPAAAVVDHTGGEKHKIISIFSPKGGVGRTTIVSNLAIALREITQKRVALVDCSLQFGDVGILFNAQPQKTIADLMPHIEHLDDDLLEEVLTSHSSGVKLLLAPQRPEMADLITGEAIAKILGKLRESYDYVLVDTWPSFQDQMLSVLDISDRILVILTLELPSIKNAKIFLEVASTLGYDDGKMTLLLNRADSTGGIKLSDVEANLRHQIPVSIVSDGRLVTQALNAGVPVVMLDKNSTVAKGIFSLANLVAEGDGKKFEASENGTPKTAFRRVASSFAFRR